MKCEKCAGELPGGKVICPQCRFNNALRHLGQRKAQAQVPHESSPAEKPETPAQPSSPLAAKVRARYASEANLIHFPVTPKSTEETATCEPPGEPAWRAETKARVRQHLERRNIEATAGGAAADGSDDPTKQLLVESALKRIRRTQSPPPIIPTTVRRGGKAQALAQALDYEEQAYEEVRLETEPVNQLADPLPAPPQFATLLHQQNTSVLNAQLSEPDSLYEEMSAQIDFVEPTLTETALLADLLDDDAESLPSQVVTRPDEAQKADLWIGKPAPMWLRTLAGAVDLEAAALAYLPFFAAYTSFDGPPEGFDLYLMIAILAVVVYLYQLITYSFNGRTVGMAICGLRCVALEEVGQPISFRRRLWQALGGTVALLCPPLNLLITRFTDYQRGLADALARTITLRRAQD